MKPDRKKLRRKSMVGTLLFALAIVAAVLAVLMRSDWIAGAAVVLLVPGAAMLYRVGRSLS